MKYKCFNGCFIIFESDTAVCPECGDTIHVRPLCPRDHCHCSHPVTELLAYCPDCGHPMCPKCECHDVEQISRVTGYLQAVSGWNAAKAQELKDRHRVNIGDEHGM